MPTRQLFHQRLMYLSEQVLKLERMGYFDKTLHKNVEEDYKDDTLAARIIIPVAGGILGAFSGFFPALIISYILGTSIRNILKAFMVTKVIYRIIGYSVDIASFLISWALVIGFFVFIGILIGNAIKKSARQKKIDNFNNYSRKMEQNLRQAQKIYEDIREDLVTWVPVEYRNSGDLRKLGECFALYNISSIPEAIELIKAKKV